MTSLPLGVVRSGLPPGPETDTFLFLHGFAASSFTWRHWTDALGERGHLVLVDLKGHGLAPPPPDLEFGPEVQAELVHDLVRELGLHRLTVLGHSLGGGVALLAALRLLDGPDRGTEPLARLVLVSAAAYRQPLPPFAYLAQWPRLSRLFLKGVGISNVVRLALRMAVHDPDTITPGMVAGYSGPLDDDQARRAILKAGGQIVPDDLEALAARYAEIDVPTLLLWGREDRVTPLWVAERLAEELPRAELELLDECGHAAPEEMPAEALARVTAFLDRHPLE